LLIVGQNDEAALGIAQAALVSLAAQFPGGNDTGTTAGASAPALRFYVLDGTPDEAPLDGILDRTAALLPRPVRVAGWRDTAEILNEIAGEVARRQSERAFDEGAILLIIHDLARFRDLRKSDDDFGFSMSRGDEDRPSPAKQLGAILRDGPGVGVHVVAWCDSLNNLHRCLDRQALREFEMRVLFQMSGNDSSALIDNPIASRLGVNRAFFVSEEEGRLEKFRPYGLPPTEWWESVRDRLRQRPRAEAGANA
jgi:hypothetical protein